MFPTIEQVRAMTTAAELDNVVTEVRNHMNDADADINSMNALLDAVEARREELRNAEAARRALAGRVNVGVEGNTVRGLSNLGDAAGTRAYSVNSVEYRNGFLKNLLHQDLTAEERDAVSYVANTTDTTYGAANLLPKTLLNQIWNLIDEQHAILADIELYRTGTILEIALLDSIEQGDAKGVEENAANDDEINKYLKVALSGKDFSKHVNITYAMAKMSVDVFESFLASEISTRLGAALASDVIAQIGTDMDTTNKALQTAKAGEVQYKDIATVLSKLKNAKGGAVFYGSHETIYNYLVGMVDTTGRPIFQPNAQAGAEGTLVGIPVKVEDGVTGNALIVGYPKQVVGNMIQDVMIENDRDIKKHVITYAGYARFECKLVAKKAFAKLTVKAS